MLFRPAEHPPLENENIKLYVEKTQSLSAEHGTGPFMLRN